jgi:hypothetical protein
MTEGGLTMEIFTVIGMTTIALLSVVGACVVVGGFIKFLKGA